MDRDLDERSIRRVLAEYCMFVDDGNFTDLVDLFAADGAFVFEGRERVGPESLLRFFEKTGGPDQRGKHITANVIVDVDGDTASARSDFVFFVRSESGLVPFLTGRYRDELRRQNEYWKLVRREALAL